MTEIVRTVRIASLNGHDELEAQTLEGTQALVAANPGMWTFVQGTLCSNPGQLVERFNDAPQGATVDLVRPLVGGFC